jgi:uncharacterized protein (AIM24 family)
MKSEMIVARMEEAGTVAGVKYQVLGELTPALTLDLSPGASVYFEHHVVLTREPRVQLEVMPLMGSWKRFVAGLPLIMVSATGPGKISFSREHPGHVFAKHLEKGRQLKCPEHTLLAATGNIQYDFEWVKGFFRNQVLGGNGMFVDTFTAKADEDAIWLHGHGNVLEHTLEKGEQIDVEPGAWIYRDPSVDMTTVYQTLTMGLLTGRNFWFNRFTGPGRVGVQTGYWEPAPAA